MKSQWITDGHAAEPWLVGCLLLLSGAAAVLGGVAWLVSTLTSGIGF